MRLVGCLCVLALATGCAGDDAASDGGAADAGPYDAGPVELPTGAMLGTPAAPAAPAVVALSPCADGWRPMDPVRSDGAATCEPWPEGGRLDCPDGQTHLPGESACTPIGPPCPAGDGFADDLPASGLVIYVRAAAAMGDGTRAAPFDAIAPALAMAAPGATVAVASGSYDEPVVLPNGVTLHGACVTQTRIAYSTRDDSEATITVSGTDVVVKNVSVGGARAGVLIDGRASARIEHVWLDGATETGLRVHRTGDATSRDMVIRRTQTDPDDGISAFGLVLEFQGTVDAERVVVEENRLAGVLADSANSILAMRDSLVRATDSEVRDGAFGVGVGSQRSASVALERVVVEDNRFNGVVSSLNDATMTVTDSIVRGTREQASGMGIGMGAAGLDTGTLSMQRCLIEDNTTAGVLSNTGVGTIELTDVVVRDTRAPSGGAFHAGDGVLVTADGSVVTATRVSAENNAGNGIRLSGPGTVGTFTDVTLIDNLPDLNGHLGVGIEVQLGALGTVRRATIARNHEAGILVTEEGASLVAEDVTVRDTLPRPDGTFGRGIHVQNGASATIARARIERPTNAGFGVLDSMADVRDLTVDDVRAAPMGPQVGFGMGLRVSGETADARFERAVVSGARAFGVIVGSGTMIAEDLRVTSTRALGADPIVSTLLGRGLDVQLGGSAQLTRALVEDSGDTAVFVHGEGSQLVVSDAVVRDTRGNEAGGGTGYGVAASGGATIDADLVLVERTRQIAVTVWDVGSAIQLSDVRVLDTREAACGVDTCAGTAGGIGVGAYDGAQLTAERFVVRRSVLAGVQIGMGGQMDLTSGEVSDSPVGANVQDPGFDLERITNDVAYRDNDVNLDSTVLPVPMPATVVEAPEDNP